jgi:DNA-binding transcriptional MerR regulator
MEYRIDELARAAETTVRTVRAYREKGLLPAPRMDGRVGYYSEHHLLRLKMISSLLKRGYSLQSIGELADAWESSQALGDLLGLEAAITDPFREEAPTTMSPEEVFRLVGPMDLESIQQAEQRGIVKFEQGHVVVPSLRLLKAAAELHQAGVPYPAMLETLDLLRKDVSVIAQRFVSLIVEHVVARYGDTLPAPKDAAALADLVRRLRPLAKTVADVELAVALETQVTQQLDERLRKHLEKISEQKAALPKAKS